MRMINAYFVFLLLAAVGFSSDLSLAEQRKLQPPPTDLERAIDLVHEGQHRQAIPLLRKAIDGDRPFGSSVTAIRWLAECYLKTNQPQKVVELFEKKPWLLDEKSRWKESVDCRRIHKQAQMDLEKQRKP